MIHTKPHILFISDWYPDRINSTLGNFIQKHAEAASRHCNVSVIHTCVDENLEGKYEVCVETINSVLTIIVYYKKVKSFWPLISQFQKVLRYLSAYSLGYARLSAEKGKPDLVHLNALLHAGLAAWFLKFRHHLNYVYTEHWTGFLPANAQFKRFSLKGFLYKYIALQSKVLMPVSENLKDALIKAGIKGDFQVISNVVDTDLFRPSLMPHDKSKFRFIHISHAMDEHKNISGILRAVEKLRNINSCFSLTIVSDGDLQPHTKYAISLGIYGTQVSFEGTKTTAEIAHLISISDCLLLFSNYENFPCVIPEAMACGIPVISTNVGGIAEHVNNSNGILVSPRNENELVMAMKKMIENSVSFQSEKLRDYSVTYFSYNTIADQLFSVYKRVLEKNA